jgi:predicted Rossmann fold nucleotide-binding protein DprA/Smf involved in DNA uptake
VLAAEDVLTALGLAARPDCAPPAPAARRLDPEGAALLELFAEQALDVEGVAARTGRSLLDVAVALGRLEEAGWLVRTAGWFERAALRGVR